MDRNLRIGKNLTHRKYSTGSNGIFVLYHRIFILSIADGQVGLDCGMMKG